MCSLTSRYPWMCQGRGHGEWESHLVGAYLPGLWYQQIFIECLLCARCYSKCWWYSSETKQTKILPPET